jgi:hypothetical protein
LVSLRVSQSEDIIYVSSPTPKPASPPPRRSCVCNLPPSVNIAHYLPSQSIHLPLTCHLDYPGANTRRSSCFKSYLQTYICPIRILPNGGLYHDANSRILIPCAVCDTSERETTKTSVLCGCVMVLCYMHHCSVIKRIDRQALATLETYGGSAWAVYKRCNTCVLLLHE